MTETEGGPLPVPGSVLELRAWLSEVAGVELADGPLIEGHSSPIEYLTHAFFEAGAMARDAPTERSGPALPAAPLAATQAGLDAVVWANRGGGKTFLGAVATMLDLVFKPGIEVRILGGSLEQSKRMHAHLRRLFERPALAPLVHGRITARGIRLRNGSDAELLAQSQTSVRGTRVQKLRCDEVELFDPEVWDAAQLATRSATLELADGRSVLVRGAIEALSTMHLPHGLMHRVVEETAAGTRRLFRWGVVDVLARCGPEHECPACVLLEECGGRAKRRVAPFGHVPVRDAIALKGRVGLAVWQAEMLSLRPRRSDCVYPEFSRLEHVVRALPASAGEAGCGTWVCGMDFGFRSPTVVLWAWVDLGCAVWVAAERIASEVVLREHVEALCAGPEGGLPGSRQPEWVGVDPAGNQRSDQSGLSAVQVLRAAGLRVRARRVLLHDGLNRVRARLRPATSAASRSTGAGEAGETSAAVAVDTGPRLFIHERCRGLIQALERYRFPPDGSTEPVKDGSDHAADALRYLVQNLDTGFGTRFSEYL